MNRLRSELKERNTSLLQEVEHQVGKATPQLWHSYATFQSGTKHTPEHTMMVESIANLLVTDELLKELRDDEIAFLILACHYHDLGMSGTEADNLTAESRERVRRAHAITVGDRILAHWKELGFGNETSAEILAQVCKGHRPDRANGEANWDNIPDSRILAPNRDVRLRVVSAIVYAADELHIGEDRAPRREEEFLEITNPEAVRHWRRHQSVQGPVLRENQVCFEGNVSSPASEEDLRKALKKAFRSVQELTEQLRKSGIESTPRSLRFIWCRKKLWDLLITKVCEDLSARSSDDIIAVVLDLYRQEMEDVESISEFCTETVMLDSSESEIRNSIADFQTRDYLIAADADTDLYVLGSDSRVAADLLDIARKADEAESLLLVKTPRQYEYNLYQSAFGRRYFHEHLYSRLEATYRIAGIATANSQQMRTALESSPTAARVAQLLKPPPSVLVQSDLFELAAITGACADLVNDPELILNPDYRHAIAQLIKSAEVRLPKFLRFVQELAIIKELGIDQVGETLVSGDEPVGEAADHPTVSLKISQTYPATRPDWSFGHLVLASRRSRAEITILNAEVAPMDLSISGPETEGVEAPPGPPRAIGIGPGKPVPPGVISYRAPIRFESGLKKLRLPFTMSFDQPNAPLLMQLTPQGGFQDRGDAHFRTSVLHTELTCGDVAALQEAMRVSKEGDLKLAVTTDPMRIQLKPGSDIAGLADCLDDRTTSWIVRLASVAPDLPLPAQISDEHVERILGCEDAALRDETDAILAEYAASRPTVTTIYLRFASADAKEYYEEFLSEFPPEFSFRAPQVSGPGIVQEDIDQKWIAGERLTLEASFRESMAELAQALRDWVRDTSKEFPFQIGHDDLQFHYAQTRLLIIFEKTIDRRWHIERKVIFRFRPVTESERYGLERDFWKNKGDDQRAALLEELFQKAAEEEVAVRDDFPENEQNT